MTNSKYVWDGGIVYGLVGLILTLSISLGPAWATLQGDVTGDGKVDGKDALKILLVLEGRIETPPDGDAFWSLADVYPMPGTDGALLGDGQVTQEDVYKLLRYVVGLVPPGEITGDFSASPPRIDGFEPTDGQAGEAITLHGANFIEGNPSENLVLFGDIAAQATESTGATLTVVVPEGAQTSPIRVVTPGGTASSAVAFTVAILRTGVLVPSSGFSPDSYMLTNQLGDTVRPSAEGVFSIPVDSKGVNLLMAFPEDGSERHLLAADIAGAPPVQEFRIDLESTARALILLTPYLGSSQPERVLAFWPTIQSNAEVSALAPVLSQLYQQTRQPFDDPQFDAAYRLALESVLASLPEHLTTELPSAGDDVGSSVAGNRMVQSVPTRGGIKMATSTGLSSQLLYIDRRYIELAVPEPGTFVPAPISGSPVDWYLHLFEVKDIYSAFPEGIKSISETRSTQVIPRGNVEEITFVAASSYLKYLDLFSVLFEETWAILTDVTTEIFPALDGLASTDTSLHVNPDHESVYVVRAFSGVLSDGVDPGEFLFVWDDLPSGATDFWVACGFNVAMAALDFSSMFIDVKQVAGANDHGRLRKTLRLGLRKGMKLATKKLVKNSGNLSSTGKLEAILELVYGAVQDIIGVVAADLSQGALVERTSWLLKLAGKSIDPLYKISVGSQSMERIVSMAGLNKQITPFETWFVIVGDPFTPVVETLSPEPVSPGGTVTLTGRHFDPKGPDYNEVRVGEHWEIATPVEALSVNADGTLLTCAIPLTLRSGDYKILIRTSYSGGVKHQKKQLQCKRVPTFTSISPNAGFAPVEDSTSPFQYYATQIIIRGTALQATSGGEDTLFFGTTGAATPITKATYDQIEASVPNVSPGELEVYLHAAENGEETQSLNFTVLGAPELTSVSPDEAAPGETITIHVTNLSPDPNEVKIIVGNTLVKGQRVDADAGTINFAMPTAGKVHEPVELVVWTPGGSTAPTQITRLEGVTMPEPLGNPLGYRIQVKLTGASEPGNQISLDEALRFAKGESNPFSQPYDDRDEIYRTDYYWRDDEWVAGNTSGPEYELGHPGAERRYHYNTYHNPDGTEDLRISSESFDTTVEDMEEGDYVTFLDETISSGGAGHADTIYIDYLDGPGPFAATSMELDAGDSLEMAGSTLILEDTPLTVNSDSSVLVGRVEVATGDAILIQGNRNQIDVHSSSSRDDNIAAPNGTAVVIKEGIGNTVIADIRQAKAMAIQVVGGGLNEILGFIADVDTGISIDRSHYNTISNASIKSASVGIELVDSMWNEINAATIEGGEDAETGISISGGVQNRLTGGVTTIRGFQTGLELVGGEQNNIYGVSAEENVTGVYLDKSRGNELWVSCVGNTGNGIYLTDSSDNTIHANIGTVVESPHWSVRGNGGHGILIEGGSRNVIGGSVHGCGIDGIHIQNSAANVILFASIGLVWLDDMPDSLEDAMNDGTGIWIGPGSPSNKIADCEIGLNGGDGIHVQGGTTEEELSEGVEITSSIIGGVHTDAREGVEDNLPLGHNGGVGIRLEGGVPGIFLAQNAIGSNEAGGILINGVTQQWPADVSPTSIGELRDNFVGYYKNQSYDYVPMDDSPGNGIELRDCTDLRLFQNWVHGHEVGILIQGLASARHNLDGNEVMKSKQQGILIIQSSRDTVRSTAEQGQSHGIELANTRGTDLVTCESEKNAADGIYLHSVQNAVVRSNLLPKGGIEFVTAIRNGGAGIRIEQSQKVRVYYAKCQYNPVAGILVADGSSEIRVDNVYGTGNTGPGVHLRGVEQISLSTNTLSKDEAEGVRIENSQHVVVQNAIIRDGGGGITILGPTTDDLQIQGCTISGVTKHGINVIAGQNILIGGPNVTHGNSVVNNGMAGIRIGPDVQIRVQNNDIGDAEVAQQNTGGGDFGPIGGAPAAEPPVVGNEIGILVENVTQEVEILDNHIHDNRDQGILITGAGTQGTLIRQNTIEANGSVGVEVTELARFHQISQNSITGNFLEGILLTNGGNDQVASPVIHSVLEGDSASGNVDAPSGSKVELYADMANEGARYLGWASVYGNSFSVYADVPPMPLHAIVIHPDGNTSEFGPTFLELPMFHLAFTSTRDNDSEIYLIRPGNPVADRVTTQPGMDHSPKITQAADQIVFVSERSGNADIWTIGANGSDAIQITAEITPDYDPAWSADNSRIAFVSERDGNPEIYTLDVRPGFEPGELAYDSGMPSPNWPWIPQVSEGDIYGVHFTSRSPASVLMGIDFYFGDRLGEFEWVILSWDNGQPGDTVIAQGIGTPTEPGWHTVEVGQVTLPSECVVGIRYATNSYFPRPDLAFATAGDGRSWRYQSGAWSPGADLMIRARFEPTAQRLTEDVGIDRHPVWSPTDAQIAFTSDRSGNLDIWVMTVTTDGTEAQRLTTDSSDDYQPTWSPDGTEIAFVSERDGNPEIYVMDLVGGDLTRLTNNLGFDVTPAWSSDGERLFFTSDRGAGMEVYSMRPDGSGVRRVTTSLGQNSQ